MDDIELGDRGEDPKGADRGSGAGGRGDSLIENTAKTDADNIRKRINSGTATQSETRVDLNDSDSTDLERQIQDRAIKKAVQRYDAIQALESATDTRFSVTHGDSSKELIDYISDIKYSEKGNLIALKFKGEDVKLTVKGKISKSAAVQNRKILKAIENAKVEYKGSFDAVVDEGAGSSVSDEARESVRRDFVDSTEDLMWDMHGVIREKDLDGKIKGEIEGIMSTDKNVDYDNLEDTDQKNWYISKIDGLKVDIEYFKNLEEKEQDPTKKLMYKTAKELCITKKSLMEANANQRPESEEAQERIQEIADTNDLTRFERFKKWAKENLVGVSAVAISVAGIVTTVVLTGRNALKKAAKPLGNFGKALANLAKKAGPAIAAILNILAQTLTWGAKALEFLSRNLWIVALFLTYLLYDTVKDRYKHR